MSENFKFPTDTCVLACSGPSLNLVDVFSLGVPVVAVSTAIRVIPNPHYWVLADFLNEMHGNEGSVAYQNENILKIIPKGKTHVRHKGSARNSIEIPYQDAPPNGGSKEAHLFSGKYPLLKGPHKSVTFAIQWLHAVGVKKVIWAGNNLKASSPQEKYAYDSTATDLRKAHNYSVTLDQVHRGLKEWYPIVKKKGFEWYSWQCGEVFEKFVPKFDIDSFVKPSESEYFRPTEKSAIEPIVIVTPAPQKHRRTKEDRRREIQVKRDKAKNNPNPIHPKEANRQRILKQRQAKLEEIQQKKSQVKIEKVEPKIQNKPKSEVSVKKYPKYVKVNSKNIRDSLR